LTRGVLQPASVTVFPEDVDLRSLQYC
jgi:hypothetical protein